MCGSCTPLRVDLARANNYEPAAEPYPPVSTNSVHPPRETF